MRTELRLAAVIFIVVVGGLAVVSASYETAGTDREMQHVGVEVVHDERIAIPGTDVQDMNATLDGSELEEGEDYHVDEPSGVIEFPSDGVTDEGDFVELEYSALVPAQLAQTFAAPLGNMIGFFAVVVLIVGIAMLLASVQTLRNRGWRQ